MPYNLCLLSSILEPYCDVEIVDANIDDLSCEQFKLVVETLKPEIVGVTALSDECGPCAHIAAKIVKNISREITTILGGIYATINFDTAITDDNIDYVVIGEAENILIQLIEGISGKGKFPVNGYAFKQNNQPVILGRADPVLNLDELPLPAYHKINFDKYATVETRHSAYKPNLLPYGRIMTSRGCNIGCNFCQNEYITGKSYRYRSVDNVLNEMEWLIRVYGIRSLLIDDANFTANIKRAKSILNGMIERSFNLKWKAMNLAVFYLDEELLELMKQSGADSIDLAIESGVDRVLRDIIRKPVRHNKVLELIRKARELDFNVSANFIIGFPGETWNEIRQTIRFAEEIEVDYVKFMVAMPLRHTKLYDLAKETGSLRKDFDFKNLRWGTGEIYTPEFNPLELSILRTYEWDRINFGTPQKRQKVAQLMGISLDELETLREQTRKGLMVTIKKNLSIGIQVR